MKNDEEGKKSESKRGGDEDFHSLIVSYSTFIFILSFFFFFLIFTFFIAFFSFYVTKFTRRREKTGENKIKILL